MEIRHFLRIRVLPEKVFEALASVEGVKGWWTEEASREGGVWKFTFAGEHPMQLRVLTEEKGSRVEWVGEGDDFWNGTKVVFDLEAENGDTTILRFSHSNWKGDEDAEAMDNINYNWGRFMFSLKSFVETGKGFAVRL
jgi:uncharacterized protein YndB with AHSA1/START domain